jgi:hypothetical protein
MANSPSDHKKVTGAIDHHGDGELDFLDDETRKRAIECIRSHGLIKITSTHVEGQGVSAPRWEQKVD